MLFAEGSEKRNFIIIVITHISSFIQQALIKHLLLHTKPCIRWYVYRDGEDMISGLLELTL